MKKIALAAALVSLLGVAACESKADKAAEAKADALEAQAAATPNEAQETQLNKEADQVEQQAGNAGATGRQCRRRRDDRKHPDDPLGSSPPCAEPPSRPRRGFCLPDVARGTGTLDRQAACHRLARANRHSAYGSRQGLRLFPRRREPKRCFGS